MNKLPNEILLKILSYTYEPQDKTLVQDIRDFHKSKLHENHWFLLALIFYCNLESIHFLFNNKRKNYVFLFF